MSKNLGWRCGEDFLMFSSVVDFSFVRYIYLLYVPVSRDCVVEASVANRGVSQSVCPPVRMFEFRARWRISTHPLCGVLAAAERMMFCGLPLVALDDEFPFATGVATESLDIERNYLVKTSLLHSCPVDALLRRYFAFSLVNNLLLPTNDLLLPTNDLLLPTNDLLLPTNGNE
jgi:hypothetical protein